VVILSILWGKVGGRGMSKFTMLCEDSGCVHNGNQGVYGICNLYKEKCGDILPVSGMERMYRSTCELRESEKK
jgi:hypothetical protein